MGASSQVGGRLSMFLYYSWDPAKQIESTEKLLGLDFLHVLPGHGRRCSFKDEAHRLEALAQCIEEAKSRA